MNMVAARGWSAEKVRVAVIGYGYWGPNLARNFANQADSALVMICDRDDQRRALASKNHPTVRVAESEREAITAVDVDAVVIATPVSTHYPIAIEALRAGKHVFVEKPAATCSDHVSHMIEEAERRHLTLMVDHTFVYSPPVRKMKEIVSTGEIGRIHYYDSTRVNLGLFQNDVNVVWDLAVHDLSIMDYLLPERPRMVSATGMNSLSPHEHIAYLSFFFDSNLIAHVGVNWLSPVKVRQILLGGASQMIVYDDLESSEKIKVYDKGITINEEPERERIHRMKFSYRTGDMRAPALDTTEALKTETSHFIDCIRTQQRPLTDGHSALWVVSVLEAATHSMRRHGHPTEIK